MPSLKAGDGYSDDAEASERRRLGIGKSWDGGPNMPTPPGNGFVYSARFLHHQYPSLCLIRQLFAPTTTDYTAHSRIESHTLQLTATPSDDHALNMAQDAHLFSVRRPREVCQQSHKDYKKHTDPMS